MPDRASLLAEFLPHSVSQWRQEVERQLRHTSFASAMYTPVVEGFDIAPIYTQADVRSLSWYETLPGQAPFVRGTRAAGYHAGPWLVAQEHREPTCEGFNIALHRALAGGQTAINLVLDEAAKRGQDPDQGSGYEVGDDGTSVCCLADLEAALAGVDLATYPLLIQTGASALPVAAMVAALVESRDGDIADLRGCLGSDPYTGLARWGRIHTSLAQMHDELAVLSRWALRSAPGVRTLPVFECPWHNGGADLALCLGLMLSAATGTLRALDERGVAPSQAAPLFQFNLELGSDFFMEMVKLRALRLLWSRILSASGVAPKGTGTYIHCRTGRRSYTVLDPQINMLRATTVAMSAVFGGTDSLHISPHDEIWGDPDAFSQRLARNVQLILAHECRFDQVTDPAGGSWFVEKLTSDLASAAWCVFQDLERQGGMQAALLSGWVQDRVARSADRRAAAFATREQVLVGVNRYPDLSKTPSLLTKPDHKGIRLCRQAVLKRQRQAVTPEENLVILARLGKIADCPSEEIFTHLMAAAEAGATLGEFTEVLRSASGPGVDVTPIPMRRDAAPFEQLRARAVTLVTESRVFVGCLDESESARARLDFVRDFFQVGGFQLATAAKFHVTPQAVAAAAQSDGAGVVVLVGSDPVSGEQVLPTVRALSKTTSAPLVVIAGVPGPDEAELRRNGVHAFVYQGQNIIDTLGPLWDELEARK